MKKDGFYVQLHMHTSETSRCGIDGGADMARACFEVGYDLIVITDHFFNANIGCDESLPWPEKVEYLFRGYRAARAEGEKLGLAVLKGWETNNGGPEFLTYGLDEAFLLNNPDIARLDADAYLRRVKAAGAHMLRGGAYKPRTSPYSYQGMGERGLDLLCEARDELDMPIVTEIMDARDVQLFLDRGIDVMQIGARNSQNFTLLKEVGKTTTPVLLKRGISGTIDELLMAAEYIMSEGNENVILCERGIRTYESRTRNTFDLSAVSVLHHLSHLPVVADPSHAVGYTRYVSDMALAATAAGADGLEIEVHDCPSEAWSDGAQALLPDQFDKTMDKVRGIRAAIAPEGE